MLSASPSCELNEVSYEVSRVIIQLYHKEAEAIAFCPYRISSLDVHIDHQFGKINGLAIDKGIHFAYKAKPSGICELHPVNFSGKRAQFHVSSIPKSKQGYWADHLSSAALKLSENYKLKFGVAGVFDRSLPIGGLSFSTAVIIAFLSALCKVNDIHPGDWELIMMAKAVENQ